VFDVAGCGGGDGFVLIIIKYIIPRINFEKIYTYVGYLDLRT